MVRFGTVFLFLFFSSCAGLRSCARDSSFNQPEAASETAAGTSSEVDEGPNYEMRSVQRKADFYPKRGFQFPRLTKHPNKDVLQQINDHLDTIAGDLGCQAEAAGDPKRLRELEEKAKFDVRSKVTLAGHDVLSVEYAIDWSCLGPYPDSNRLAVSFDLRDGHELTFDELFKDKASVETARELLFNDAIRTTQRTESCREALQTMPAADSTVRFSLTATGIHAWIERPHELRNCDLEGQATYAALKPLLKPDGPLRLRIPRAP